MKKVLLINHDTNSRIVLKECLAGFYQVFDVASGTEAIDLAQRNPLDLILLDMEMPGIDGVGLAHAVRADPALVRIKLILLTSVGRIGGE
ncbi:MAG: response regulator, partial [Desulfobulbaceae bacterium]|nr:response regulator [Desulfobulbaceae bacterium]